MNPTFSTDRDARVRKHPRRLLALAALSAMLTLALGACNSSTSKALNTAPVASAVSATTNEDAAVTFKLSATDLDGDSLTYAVATKPSHGTVTCTTSGSCTYTPSAHYSGSDSFTYTASDTASQSSTATVSLTIAAVTPTISGSPTTTATENTAYSYTGISAADADTGETLTFSMTGNPSWLSINASTGALSGTPALADVGTTSAITVTVTDAGGVTASLPSFKITVAKVAPTISGSPTTAATVDIPYSYSGITATDVDSGQTLTYSMSGAPSWLSINASSGALSGTPTATGTASGIIVTVTDTAGASASLASFAITVAANAPPTISGSPTAAATENSAYSYTSISASDTDTGDTLTFSMSGNPSWLSINSSTGALSGTPALADVGTTGAITVTVTDAAGGTASLSAFTITVAKAPPTISGSPTTTGTVDIPYSYSGITASDVDSGQTLTYSMSGAPSWLSINSSTGVLSGTPTSTATAGPITVTVTDTAGASAALTSFSITVAANAAPTVSTAIPAQKLTVQVPNAVLGLGSYFTDPDSGDSLTYSVTSNSSTASVTTSISGANLTLTYQSAAVTSDSITVQAKDLAGNTVTSTFSVTFSYAAYSTNGANWDDYVNNDGTDQFSATDTACTSSGASGYTACIHGGEVRAIPTGITSCSGLSATDALGAFNWSCKVNSTMGVAVFYSTGLADGKNLSDLIDFTTPAWKSDSLTVTGSSSFTSASTTWWSNPVVAATQTSSTGATLTLSTAGDVYVMTTNIDQAVEFGANSVALVIEPGVTLTNSHYSTDADNNISVRTHNYDWVEGTIDVTGGTTGLYLSSANFCVVRHFRAMFGTVGADWAGSEANKGYDLMFAQQKLGQGLELQTGGYNTISRVTTEELSSNGIDITQNTTRNSISDVIGVGGYSVANFSQATDTTLLDVTQVNSDTAALSIQSSGSGNLISGIASANDAYGVYLTGTSSGTISNVAVANGSYGVYATSATGSPGWIWSGLLKVGNNSTDDCYVDSEATSTGAGFADDSGSVAATHSGLCVMTGSSTATVTTGIDTTSSLVGKITTDDTTNTSDSSGSATYPSSPSSFDWFNFDNQWRAWGIDGTFPSSSIQGYWTSGTGRIWELRLSSTDTVLRNALTTYASGDDYATHTWSDGTTTKYLKNAVEISGDGIGNDNGLCESNEACIQTPNIGAYQGEGTLTPVTFTDSTSGGLTGIKLYKYATNGH